MRIRYSKHSIIQMAERGATKREVETAILKGEKVPAKKDRYAFRWNFQFGKIWAGQRYHTKQVMPIVKEENSEYVVITVYVFYF